MAISPRADSGSRFPDARAEKIAEFVEPTVSAHGLYLEELVLTGGGGSSVVKVVVDYESGTQNVDLDTLAGLSEALGVVLDQCEQQTPLDQAPTYDLEVTTPGVTRPLTEPRHFHRNMGRVLEVERSGADMVAGRLQQVDETGIVITEIRPAPKKGMTPKVGPDTPVAFEDITRARVRVEFSHSE